VTAIVRLYLPRDRLALEAHFAALGTEDLYNRFCHSINSEGVAEYLDRLRATGIPSYGIFDSNLALIAVSQLARSEEDLEVGLTVLPTYRRKGLAVALLYRAASYGRARGLKALVIHCLASNTPMLCLARKIGMSVEISDGEADGHLKLRAGTALDFWREIAYDQEGIAAAVLKSWPLAVQTALGGATPTKGSGT
jgi:GNAT superfamily N-acetyltransferase